MRETEESDRVFIVHMLSSRMRAGVPVDYLHIGTLVVKDPEEARRVFVPRLEVLVSHVEVDDITKRDPATGMCDLD